MNSTSFVNLFTTLNLNTPKSVNITKTNSVVSAQSLALDKVTLRALSHILSVQALLALQVYLVLHPLRQESWAVHPLTTILIILETENRETETEMIETGRETEIAA